MSGALPRDDGSSPRRVPVEHLLALAAFMLRSTAAAEPPSSAGVHERREKERKREERKREEKERREKERKNMRCNTGCFWL